MLHITDVRTSSGHTIWLRFSDGAEGFVDLSRELDGPVFEPLRDPVLFAQVRLDAEFKTVAWPNGADFAPEYLRALVGPSA